MSGLSFPIEVRAYGPGDLAVVVRSWNESAAPSSPWCPRHVFWYHHRRWLERAVFDPRQRCGKPVPLERTPSIWIASSPADRDRILGWVAASAYSAPPRVWWVWTRDTWRHGGIATRLLAEVMATARAKLSAGAWSRAAPGLVRATREMWLDWPDCYRPEG